MADSNFQTKKYSMNKKKINIVMFNMSKYSDWQKGVVNRNFHILHTLAKSDQVNKIIAVDFLPFNFKRGIKTYIYDQIFGDTKGTIVSGNLSSRCWQISSKIFNFSTIDNLLKPKKVISELNKIIKDQEMNDNLVVWNYNPFYTDYLDNGLNQSMNIFTAVDNWLSHSSYSKSITKLEKNYNIIDQKSDLIFTVSESLKNNLFKNKNTHWIPNGVNLNHFTNETKISEQLIKIKKPIIGFLGILQDRIDIDILKTLAKNNPDKSIVLAGPVWKNFPKNELDSFNNVHFLGPIPYTEIPSLYNGFAVGIIPYKVNKFTKSIDPMKIYEYLAARLPIVTTPIAGLEKFADYVNVAKTPEQFDDFVNTSIMEGKLNSSYEILNDHTWQKRVNKILELINTKFK